MKKNKIKYFPFKQLIHVQFKGISRNLSVRNNFYFFQENKYFFHYVNFASEKENVLFSSLFILLINLLNVHRNCHRIRVQCPCTIFLLYLSFLFCFLFNSLLLRISFHFCLRRTSFTVRERMRIIIRAPGLKTWLGYFAKSWLGWQWILTIEAQLTAKRLPILQTVFGVRFLPKMLA